MYILQCNDDSYYVGFTNNLDTRLKQHNAGHYPNAHTVNRRPVKLVWHSFFNDAEQALQVEKQLKGWSRKKKEALINEQWELLPKLAKKHFGR